MKLTAFFTILILAILIMTCGKSNDPVKTGPLFSLRVVDTAGTAMANLRVGSINHSNYLSKRAVPLKVCPTTGIQFDLPAAAQVTLDIVNYYGGHVASLLDSTNIEAGGHVIQWDGRDDGGKQVLSGYYRYVLTAWDSDTVLLTTAKWMVLDYAPDPAQTIIGSTNNDGMFITSDTLLFPCLLGAPPEITQTDDTGLVITIYDFYQDTVTITLSDTIRPDRFMYFKKGLTTGNNRFELVWDSSLAY